MLRFFLLVASTVLVGGSVHKLLGTSSEFTLNLPVIFKEVVQKMPDEFKDGLLKYYLNIIQNNEIPLIERENYVHLQHSVSFANDRNMMDSIKVFSSFPCPEPDTISPCVCSVEEKGLLLDCSNVASDAELETIFQKEFPTKEF